MRRRRNRAVLAVLVIVAAGMPAMLDVAPAAPATFPGTNGAIAFMRLADDAVSGEIWLTAPDVSSVVQLTHGTNDWAPAISPDGTKIAFVSDRSGDAQIHVMDIDGDKRGPAHHGGWE